MAFKRSAVRSRLSPPKVVKSTRFHDFFFVFAHKSCCGHITGGKENASHHYTAERVKQMIEKEKKVYGWEFLFLGANIDAVETAKNFGIGKNRAVTYVGDREGTRLNYEVVGEAVSSMRCCDEISDDWMNEIKEDVARRLRW